MSTAPKSLGELARLSGGELQRASASLNISGVAPLEIATPQQIAFYANPSYRRHLSTSRAAVIIVSRGDASLPELADRALLIARTPYAAFAKISAAFHPPPAVVPGVDPLAKVEAGAEVDPSARVEAFAHVCAGARVGPGVVVMSGAYVGANVHIGERSILYPRAVVRERCVVGARCIIHPGAVIGADGFGFAFDPEGDGEGPIHRKIPQAGIVRIEDDVEVGANSCVDRATFGETVIGRGTKIDNLVQIAHNVQVGPLCVFASQVGIAGSTNVGAGVALGGQVGVVGHIQVGDMVRVAARSAVLREAEAGTTLSGHPAIEQAKWLRSATAFAKLPEMLRELRSLGRRLTALEQRTEPKDDTSSLS